MIAMAWFSVQSLPYNGEYPRALYLLKPETATEVRKLEVSISSELSYERADRNQCLIPNCYRQKTPTAQQCQQTGQLKQTNLKSTN